MQARGPLMSEHRLIERVLEQIESTGKVDPLTIDTAHIEKEDKIFFPTSRNYFTEEEDQAMLARFWEFDRKMIHDKYKSVVEELERE